MQIIPPNAQQRSAPLTPGTYFGGEEYCAMPPPLWATA